ncbi:MAG TPA: hypothetical protein VF526_22780 [Solirubrobacteraceae bacterium]|jgi:hypothetical protein
MTRDDSTPDRDFDPDAGLHEESSVPVNALALALRYGMRYSGLREVELDSRLLLYVPLDVCERETVLPLSVSKELLEVATASPDPDIEIVRGRFPELEIELVLAPTERIAELHDALKAAV